MDDRERLRAALAELERHRASLAALGARHADTIALLAHDIKGPLTSIAGFAELLEEGLVEGEEAIAAARTIRANAQRLSSLASGAVTVARFDPGSFDIADEPVDFAELVNRAVIARGSEHEMHLTGIEDAWVRGDEKRLREVVDIVLDNAVRYSPGGEAVDVTVERSGTNVAVRVRDRGIGIPADDSGRIFERFGRASNARRAKLSGSGAGLFVARAILERHGGTIEVHTTPEEGTAFVFVLPLLESSSPALNVTIVLKDRDLRHFLASELRERRYGVREASRLGDAPASGVREGDVVLVDARDVGAAAVRTAFAPKSVRVIGAGGGPDDGWDAVVPLPFLLEELLRAISPNGK